ncbi:hypothetical protein BJ742DRAFT_127977 [Cladochytrium replicatum]|nr:hypothetical protein BJ742DRAFT_127977 [Cladochytrium replicatum]
MVGFGVFRVLCNGVAAARVHKLHECLCLLRTKCDFLPSRFGSKIPSSRLFPQGCTRNCRRIPLQCERRARRARAPRSTLVHRSGFQPHGNGYGRRML